MVGIPIWPKISTTISKAQIWNQAEYVIVLEECHSSIFQRFNGKNLTSFGRAENFKRKAVQTD